MEGQDKFSKEENDSDNINTPISQLKVKVIGWRNEGVSIGEVRSRLEEFNYSEEVISSIIAEVDRYEFETLKKKEERKKLVSRMIIGGSLSGIGVILTLILHNKGSIEGIMYIYTFGPMVVGYVIFKLAFSKFRKINEELEKEEKGLS